MLEVTLWVRLCNVDVGAIASNRQASGEGVARDNGRFHRLVSTSLAAEKQENQHNP